MSSLDPGRQDVRQVALHEESDSHQAVSMRGDGVSSTGYGFVIGSKVGYL